MFTASSTKLLRSLDTHTTPRIATGFALQAISGRDLGTLLEHASYATFTANEK